MKSKTELYAAYTIYSSNDQYSLEANIDYNKDDDPFYMPALTFLKIKDKDYIDEKLSWDNEEYLLLLYNALRKYEDFGKFTTEERYALKDLSDVTNNLREDFSVILELLEKGVKIGMFNRTLKK